QTTTTRYGCTTARTDTSDPATTARLGFLSTSALKRSLIEPNISAAPAAKCTCEKTERNAIASGMFRSAEPEPGVASNSSILYFRGYTNQPSPADIAYNHSEYCTCPRDFKTLPATALAPNKSKSPASSLPR